MSAEIYDDLEGIGGPGSGTAVGELDFCEGCKAGIGCCMSPGRDAEPGQCECDGLCVTRAAKEASTDEA